MCSLCARRGSSKWRRFDYAAPMSFECGFTFLVSVCVRVAASERPSDLNDIVSRFFFPYVVQAPTTLPARARTPTICRRCCCYSHLLSLRNSDLAAIPDGGEAAQALAGAFRALQRPATPPPLSRRARRQRHRCSLFSTRCCGDAGRAAACVRGASSRASRSRTKGGGAGPWAGHARRCRQFENFTEGSGASDTL